VAQGDQTIGIELGSETTLLKEHRQGRYQVPVLLPQHQPLPGLEEGEGDHVQIQAPLLVE